MEPVTHSLTGLLLARTGFNRLAPGATMLLAITAQLPDLDYVSSLDSPATQLIWHRGYTHSVVCAPLVALLALPFWWLFFRRRRELTRRDWAGAYLASLVGVLSHLALDYLNVFGLRLAMPLSHQWYGGSLVNLIDLWMWVILAICIGGPMLGRLVYSEIGARGSSGRGMAIAGLLAMAAYTGLRANLHGAAIETMQARLYQKEQPRQVFAIPSAASPWRWTGVVETERAWHVLPINLAMKEFDPDAGRTFFKPDVSRFKDAVESTRTGRAFVGYSRAPLWRTLPASQPPGATLVHIYDLRFGPPDTPTLSASFLVDANTKVVRESVTFGKIKPETP